MTTQTLTVGTCYQSKDNPNKFACVERVMEEPNLVWYRIGYLDQGEMDYVYETTISYFISTYPTQL